MLSYNKVVVFQQFDYITLISNIITLNKKQQLCIINIYKIIIIFIAKFTHKK